MTKQEYRAVVENVQPDTHLESRIQRNLAGRLLSKKRRQPVRWIGVTAAVVCLLLAVSFGMPQLVSLPTESGTESERKIVFGGLTVAAYNINEGEEPVSTILSPNVEIPLPGYSPLMSSVIGFPFSAQAEDGQADEIEVSASAGSIICIGQGSENGSWEAPKMEGTREWLAFVRCLPGQMIYWSPLQEGDMAQETLLTFTAYRAGEKLGSSRVQIYCSDVPGWGGSYYMARLLEEE